MKFFLFRISLYALGVYIFWRIISRRPHQFYALDPSNNLVPININPMYPPQFQPDQQYNYQTPYQNNPAPGPHVGPNYYQNSYPMGRMQSNYMPQNQYNPGQAGQGQYVA